MKNPSIQRTTAVSFLLHSLFFMVFFFTVKNKVHYMPPSAYTVNLISPAHKAATKKHMVSAEKVQIPQKKTIVKKSTTPEPAKSVKKKSTKMRAAPAKKKVKKVITEDRTSLVAERVSALRAKNRIKKIAQLRSVIDLKRGEAIHKRGQGTAPVHSERNMSGSLIDAYYISIQQRIRKHWAYPDAGAENLIATVSFIIKRDGNIESLKVEEPSGNALFDRSIVNAISKSLPLPPPPFQMEIGIRFYP